MARNAQLRSQSRYAVPRQYSGETGSSQNLGENLPPHKYVDSKGNMKLTFKQLAIFWIGTSLFMLLAFVLGFSAGKREGAISVLDQEGEQMVRLELHTPIEPYPSIGDEGELERGDVANEDDLNSAKKAIISDKSLVAKQELKIEKDEPSKIDFTANAGFKNNSLDKTAVEKNETGKKVTEKFEEIYPGKNLFNPPSVKEEKIVKQVELPQPSQVQEQPAVVEKQTQVGPQIDKLVPKSGWYVQVAAAASEGEALRYYDKITAKGLKSSLEPAAIKNRSFYRILVGPYASQAEAVNSRTNLKQQIGTPSEPFIRQVK